MEFTIRALQLHKDITLPETGPAPDGTSELYEYRSLVAKNNLEPAKNEHLADRAAIREIKSGFYLFTQGTIPAETGKGSLEGLFLDGAEAIWLEALWQEAEFADDRIYVRILSEDSKTVFQVFREVIQRH